MEDLLAHLQGKEQKACWGLPHLPSWGLGCFSSGRTLPSTLILVSPVPLFLEQNYGKQSMVFFTLIVQRLMI